MADTTRPSLHIRELVIRGGGRTNAAQTARAFGTALEAQISSIQGASDLGSQTLRARASSQSGSEAGMSAARALVRQLSGGASD